MSEGTKVVRSVDVAIDPETAFRVFTDDIDVWYRSGPYSWNDPERAIGIRFEPGVGGRLIEVWDEAGEGYEMGRIVAWEPGVRVAFAYRNESLPPVPTEVEVRFEPTSAGTRVTLEHSGLERLPPEDAERMARYAWIELLRWFREHMELLEHR